MGDTWRYGCCPDCGLMTVGSSNGPLCNCCTVLDGGGRGRKRRVVSGPVDLRQLLVMGKEPNPERVTLATAESLRQVRDHYGRRMDGCRCGGDRDPSACDRCEADDAFWMMCNDELVRRSGNVAEAVRVDLPPWTCEVALTVSRGAESVRAWRSWDGLYGSPVERSVTLGRLVGMFGPSFVGAFSFAGAITEVPTPEQEQESLARLSRERRSLAEQAARVLFDQGLYAESNAVREVCAELERRDERERAQEERIRALDAAADGLHANIAELLKVVDERLSEPTWTTKSGERLRADQFRSGHLVNTVRLIERMAADPEGLEPPTNVGVRLLEMMNRAANVNDLAAKAGTPGLAVPPISRLFPAYPHLLAEARLRGLSIDGGPSKPGWRFVLGTEAAESLEAMAWFTGQERRGEVVRDGLTLYEDLLRRRLEGERVFLMSAEGTSLVEYLYEPFLGGSKPMDDGDEEEETDRDRE